MTNNLSYFFPFFSLEKPVGPPCDISPPFISLLDPMIPLKEKMRLLNYFKMTETKNSSTHLIHFISKNIHTPPDILYRAPFFGKLYDEVYHELVLKKIDIQKKVLRLLEFLAMPPHQRKAEDLVLFCQQIKKIKKEIFKEQLRNKTKNAK